VKKKKPEKEKEGRQKGRRRTGGPRKGKRGSSHKVAVPPTLMKRIGNRLG